MKKILLLAVMSLFVFSCSKESDSSKDVDIDRAIQLSKSYIENSDLAMAYLRRIQPGTQMCTEAEGSLVSPDFEAWTILTLPATGTDSYAEVWTVVFVGTDDGSIKTIKGVPDRDPYRNTENTRLLRFIQK